MKFLNKLTAGFLALTLCNCFVPLTSASTICEDINNVGYEDTTDLDVSENYETNIETSVSPYTVENGVYFIKNVLSGKYLDVLNQCTEDGASVIQNAYSGQKSQQFQVQYETDGYYTLKPLHTELESAVDLRSSRLANVNGTTAQIYEYDSFYEEQKFIINYDPRYIGYQIGTKCSGGNKVLGVVGNSLDDLALIEIWNQSYVSMNDIWTFEKANFGSSPSYEEIETTSASINCLGFAFRINADVGASSLGVNTGNTVEEVAAATINYFESNYPSRTIRRIPGTNLTPTYQINNNEYRVALRLKDKPNLYHCWDYHFMIQLSDGSWAHKRGTGNSSYLGFINPSTAVWPGTYPNDYNDSDVIYFAVSY